MNKPINRSDFEHLLPGRCRWIAERIGIPESHLTGKHISCPMCGGKDRFRFDDKGGRGTWICGQSCGAGDIYKLIQLFRRCSFREALRAVADVLGGGPIDLPEPRKIEHRKSPSSTDWEKHRRMVRAWEEALPITATDPAGKYLKETREIRLASFSSALRFHPSVPVALAGNHLRLPAMLAAFSSANGDLVQVHRTFLSETGTKADIENPKRFMASWKDGATRGGAVRLFEPTNILGICEGIETSMSVNAAFSIPVWATCSAGLMKQVIIPETVSEVWIFADNDEFKAGHRAGNEAAQMLAQRLVREGRKVKLLLPKSTDEDFADIFTKEQV